MLTPGNVSGRSALEPLIVWLNKAEERTEVRAERDWTLMNSTMLRRSPNCNNNGQSRLGREIIHRSTAGEAEISERQANTMNYNARHLMFLIICMILSEYEANDKSILSRKRRYIVFPEGSTFSVALCLTVHTLTPDNIFTEGLNWGISYDLPNESKPALEPFLELRNDKLKSGNKHDRYGLIAVANKNGPLKYSGWNNDVRTHFAPGGKKYRKSEYYYLQRRHRRDLYNKLEVIMNAMGFDGRTCILRALCEASQRLMPKGNTLIEEMMRISFSLPLKRVFSFEPDEHRTYTQAHKAGHEGKDCAAMFPGCSFSLIDLALGKYNAAPPSDPNPADLATETFGTEDESVADWSRYSMK